MSAILPFLTDSEIKEVTAPLTQPAAIVRWFKNNGFGEVKVRPNGMPLINRAHFDTVTAGAQKQEENKGEQPDAAAYLKRLATKAKQRAAA